MKYLLNFEKEGESFIYEIYESVMKIAGTSSRPFTEFTQEDYDALTRLKWRWFGSKINANNQGPVEEAK